MDKRRFIERDICTKCITPALRKAGWDTISQIKEEKSFTKDQIIVRGKLVTRGQTAGSTRRLLEALLHEALEPAADVLEAAE